MVIVSANPGSTRCHTNCSMKRNTENTASGGEIRKAIAMRTISRPNVEVTGARLRTEDQGAMLSARPRTPPGYTAADHLRLPVAGIGNETTYSTLIFTQL